MFAILAFSTAVATAVPAPKAAANPSMFHLDGGYGRSIEARAPGGSFAFGAGVISPIGQGRFGIGGEAGYALLGSQLHGERATQAGLETANERWSAGHISGQVYLFLTSRDRARLYPCVGLGFYDYRGVDREWEREHRGITPPIETDHGIFGINGGIGWISGNPDEEIVFGFDARIHSLSTSGSRTEIFLLMASLYF
jgi:hypothetical protein